MACIDGDTVQPTHSAEIDALYASSSTVAATSGAVDDKDPSHCFPAHLTAATLLGRTLCLPPADVLPLPAGGGYLVVCRARRSAPHRQRPYALPEQPRRNSHSSSRSNSGGSSSSSRSSEPWTEQDEACYQNRLQQLKRGLQLVLARRLLSRVRPGMPGSVLG